MAIRGSVTCRRSRSARPKLPVVKRHDIVRYLLVNRGNLTFAPFRLPFLESSQFFSAVARFARPEE